MLTTLLLTAALSTANAADLANGQTLYATCGTCHGAAGEGNVAMNAPLIGGQEAWYVQRQLELFRGKQRGADGTVDMYGAQMAPLAEALADDAAIADVAAYVASLAPAPGLTDGGGDAANGATLYAPCAGCHGAKAEGNVAMNAPALANQHDWYLNRQLANFKAGVRGAAEGDTFGAQMKPMADMLADDQAVKDVVAFIVSQR